MSNSFLRKITKLKLALVFEAALKTLQHSRKRAERRERLVGLQKQKAQLTR